MLSKESLQRRLHQPEEMAGGKKQKSKTLVSLFFREYFGAEIGEESPRLREP